MPGMEGYAGEFTPEVNQAFYDKMANRIKNQGAADVGNARSEALSRGMAGDPFEAQAVGASRAATGNTLADFDATLGYNVAGLQREERMGVQNRGYQVEDRNFDAAEAEKDRAFRQRMMELGYDQESDREAKSNRRGYQSAITNAGIGLVGKGVGYGMYGR